MVQFDGWREMTSYFDVYYSVVLWFARVGKIGCVGCKPVYIDILWQKIFTLHSVNYTLDLYGRVIVFNATFNNISVISWRSFLLMEYPEPEKITDLP